MFSNKEIKRRLRWMFSSITNQYTRVDCIREYKNTFFNVYTRDDPSVGKFSCIMILSKDTSLRMLTKNAFAIGHVYDEFDPAFEKNDKRMNEIINLVKTTDITKEDVAALLFEIPAAFRGMACNYLGISNIEFWRRLK